MGNRAIEIFQTVDDVKALLQDLHSSKLGPIVCLSMGHELECPSELSFNEIRNGGRFLLSKRGFLDRIKCVRGKSGLLFINELQSEGILVGCSRVESDRMDRGRFWYRTLLLKTEAEKLTEVPKSAEFVEWAVMVYRRVRSVAARVEVSNSRVLCLTEASRWLRAHHGEIDALGDYSVSRIV